MSRKSARQFPGASHYDDRHGRRRWRFRKHGFTAELGTDYGSEDFVRRYEAAVQGMRARKGLAGSSRTVPGSLSALVASFYRTPEFMALAESTKRTYRSEIEPTREKHGTKRIAHLQPRHVKELLAEKADTPAAANNLRKRLRQLLEHAVTLEWRTDNPVARTKAYRTSGEGFHTWDEGEIARFYEVHAAGTVAHTAMTLMLYTAAARADAVALGWQNVRDGRLAYRRRKTLSSDGHLIDIPIHPALAAVLDALPRDRLTFLQTVYGRARTPEGLGTAMRGWCDKAGLPDCSSHGLRKACSRRLAEAGCTNAQIKAITGHKTDAEVTRYTAAVDRAAAADDGMAKLKGGTKAKRNVVNLPKRFAKRSRNPLTDHEK